MLFKLLQDVSAGIVVPSVSLKGQHQKFRWIFLQELLNIFEHSLKVEKVDGLMTNSERSLAIDSYIQMSDPLIQLLVNVHTLALKDVARHLEITVASTAIVSSGNG